jgi:hypothetical protein
MWHVGEKRNACSILVGKCEGKRALGRLRLYETTVLKVGLKDTG